MDFFREAIKYIFSLIDSSSVFVGCLFNPFPTDEGRFNIGTASSYVSFEQGITSLAVRCLADKSTKVCTTQKSKMIAVLT